MLFLTALCLMYFSPTQLVRTVNHVKMNKAIWILEPQSILSSRLRPGGECPDHLICVWLYLIWLMSCSRWSLTILTLMNVIISGAVKICPDLNLGNQHQPGHLVTLVSVSQSEASIGEMDQWEARYVEEVTPGHVWVWGLCWCPHVPILMTPLSTYQHL